MRLVAPNDPALRLRARKVSERHMAGNRWLLASMLKIMFDYQGVGLAANQVGILKRAIVAVTNHAIHTLFNPEIVEHSEETSVAEEGCLSLPGVYVPVRRYNTVLVTAWNQSGRRVKIYAEGRDAAIFQHEIDHLDGILLTDRQELPLASTPE